MKQRVTDTETAQQTQYVLSAALCKPALPPIRAPCCCTDVSHDTVGLEVWLRHFEMEGFDMESQRISSQLDIHNWLVWRSIVRIMCFKLVSLLHIAYMIHAWDGVYFYK